MKLDQRRGQDVWKFGGNLQRYVIDYSSEITFIARNISLREKMNVLQIMKSGGLHGCSIGRIGPYPLYMESFESLVENNKVSDEIMDALFHLFSMKKPDVLAINTQTLTHILEGRARARSCYFTKKNIFENKTEVVGPYLEDGNHWTFFHCSIVDQTIMYLNSLGETKHQYNKIAENWSTFAASKGCQGPWKWVIRKHSLQSDSISCGVFTAVFAEAILEGSKGYLACSPAPQERERLGWFLFRSLDKSGICGICHNTVPRKNKEKCSTCLVNIHNKCLPGNQEDAKCLFCQEDSSEEGNRNKETEGQDSSEEGNRKKETEGQDSSEESNRNKETGGQDSSEEGNRKKETEGQDSSEESNRNAGIWGESRSGHNQDQTGGFLVESALKVSDFHQAKRYLVTSDELQRRCSLPESYSANTIVAYLRRAKGQKKKIIEELEVKPSKRTKLTSQCSKLCEDECSDLAGDIMYLATKFIPQKKVAEGLLEEGNVNEAMFKTEDCRKTMNALQDALESNWETFDLATHGLGPAVIKGTFALVDACLKEKMRALKSKVSTDE